MQFKQLSSSALVANSQCFALYADECGTCDGELLLLINGRLKAGGLGGRAGLILFVKRPLFGDDEERSWTLRLQFSKPEMH